MIDASPVEAMGLGVFSDGQAFHKPLLKITGVVAQNCFQAVLQKEQVTLELLEILPRYSDVPFLFDTQSILGPAEPILLAKLLSVSVVGAGTGPVPIIVAIFGVSIRFLYRADETILLKILYR